MNLRFSTPLVAFLLVFSGAPLPALDIAFPSEADLTDHFKAVAGSKAVAFAGEEGGVMRFTSADKLTFSRLTLVDRQQRTLGLADGAVEVTFRFKELLESFGVLVRVKGNDEKAYLALVNLSETGGSALRLFKVSPLDTPNEDNILVFKGTKAIFPNEWYRLRIKFGAKAGKAAKIETEVLPEKGGSPIVSAEVEDENEPVMEAGQIQLRFYAANVPSEIEVKNVSVSPDPKVVR